MCLLFSGDHGQPQSPHSAAPLPLVPTGVFSPKMPRLDHLSHAAQLVPRAAAAGHTDRCDGQRMEKASLAGLSPGTSSYTPAQAGDKASAHLTAEREFNPVPEPSGLQSSPFLILPPAQSDRCSQGWLWPLPQPRDALLGSPALQQSRGAAGTPTAPSPAPPGQQVSASCWQRVMGGTQGFCGRHLFLPKSLSRVSPAQKPPGTGKAAGEEAFPMELERRKDFPFLQWVSPTLLALQHLLQVWDLPQSPRKGQGRGRVAFNMSTNVLTETPWRVLSWLLGSFPHTQAEEAEPAGLGRVLSPLPPSTQGPGVFNTFVTFGQLWAGKGHKRGWRKPCWHRANMNFHADGGAWGEGRKKKRDGERLGGNQSGRRVGEKA